LSTADSTPLEHKATAPRTVGCWVLTVSDTKTPETDTSGALIRKLLTDAGHPVVGSSIVRDEPKDVQRVIREAREFFQALPGLGIAPGGAQVEERTSTVHLRPDWFANPFREALLPGVDGSAENFVVEIGRGVGKAAAFGEICAETLEGLVSAAHIGVIALYTGGSTTLAWTTITATYALVILIGS
jgi:molybdenum cofactor biosynthesis protein B